MRAQQEPEFQRPETAAERHRPLGIVDYAVMAVRLQEFGSDRQRAHKVFRLTNELDRAIELRAQPFVRVEDNRIGTLDTRPEMPVFPADHCRSCPSCVDMQIKPMPLRYSGNGGDVVGAAGAGAADAGDDAGG